MIVTSEFSPAWWLSNRHLQTLFPALLRKVPLVPTRWEQFDLPDGDFIDLVWTSNKTAKDAPIVVVLHGLEGSLNSSYTRGLLNTVSSQGWTGVLMHFRGCSGRHNRLDRSYHSGDTGDAQQLFTYLKQRYPERPLAAVGISLGGNVLLKYLGEKGNESLLAAAIAISVPFDLADGARALGKGASRLYQWHLISHIRDKMKDKFRDRPAPVDMNKLEQWRDFFSLDDNVTAPVHGFKDVDDYYTRSSSRQFLPDITIPTLVLHSADDPFMSTAAIPTNAELPDVVTLELSQRGGHVGFVYGSLFKPSYWIDKRAAEFLQLHLQQ